MITIDAPPGELNVRIISSILNLVCPQCGGRMSEYQCERDLRQKLASRMGVGKSGSEKLAAPRQPVS